MACQLEALLHELSLERLRLKQEQKKLERVAAGVMIDLQSSLLVDDDVVVVSAPVGLPRRPSESELSFMLAKNTFDRQISKDDISVRSRSINSSTPQRELGLEDEDIQRTIRPVQSDSPSRLVHCSPNSLSPEHVSTPTRLNFRTGLIGHTCLASSRTHSHDFLESPRDTSHSSMSNHSGLTPQKSVAVKVPPRVQGRRSIY